jgi:multisubunit Na+/H+ antiporter MnhE subunit
MNRFLLALILLWRFISAMLQSAWATSKMILTDSNAPNRGYARLHYGDLNDAGVMLLAAMITLTPGTSTLDIDRDNCELLLHVLDTTDIEVVLDGLRRDFLIPIRTLYGGTE